VDEVCPSVSERERLRHDLPTVEIAPLEMGGALTVDKQASLSELIRPLDRVEAMLARGCGRIGARPERG
jgi:hypothetical protein